MADWKYRCYDDGKGEPNLWQRWHDAHPEARGSHDGTLKVLEQQERWEFPNWRPLVGDLKGVSEIRFKGKDKKAWRIFGYTDQAAQEFTVLAIGYHKDKNYTPSNVLGLAKGRFDEIRRDPRKAPSCEPPRKR